MAKHQDSRRKSNRQVPRQYNETPKGEAYVPYYVQSRGQYCVEVSVNVTGRPNQHVVGWYATYEQADEAAEAWADDRRGEGWQVTGAY